MPYTYKALASVCVFMLVLFALSASDAPTGPWILAIATMAFVTPLTLALWPKPRYATVSGRSPMVPR